MSSVDHIYLGQSRHYLIDLVQNLLAHSSAIIFIEGPPGSGRSLLLHYIEQQISQLPAGKSGVSLDIVDDIDQLPESEFSRLTQANGSGGLVVAGLPGSCEKLKQRGYFGQRPVERLTIPPFTRHEAEQFLNGYCAPVPARIRRRLLDQCRLYPGELQQATYNTELAQSHLPSRRLLGWIITLIISSVITLLLLWARFYLLPDIDRAPAITAQQETSGPVNRELAVLPETPRKPEPDPPIVSSRSLSPPATVKELLEKPEEKSLESHVEEPAETPELFATQIKPEMEVITTVIEDPITSPPALKPPSLDRQQILNKNPQHFTLQLMLASNLENVDQLIDRIGIEKQSYRYAKIVDQQLRYCLIYGDFDTYELAGIAMKKLPAKFQRLGPWRRQFSGIQKELAAETGPD